VFADCGKGVIIMSILWIMNFLTFAAAAQWWNKRHLYEFSWSSE